MESKKITYLLEGQAFQDGLSINELNIGLSEFQHLIEGSYLSLSGQQRMSKQDRSKLKIISREIKQGSFIGSFELQVIDTSMQLALPIVATLTPFQIWKLTKDTFAFLKLIFTLTKQETPIDIKVGDNNSGVTVNVIDKQEINNQYVFNGPVYMCAEQSLPNYRNLTKLIDNGDIDRVAVESGNEIGVNLTTKDKQLFVLPVKKEELPITIKAEIYRFDKYKNTGKMRVYPQQSIPEGDYSFSLEDKQEFDRFIFYMARDIVKAKVMAEYIDDPFTGSKISKLKLLDIA